MKKPIMLFVILVTGIIIANAQCTSNYSYSGTTDTLTFTNLSTVSNAHYYWHFGDGSGSNDVNPIHIFPDDGEYLVTLYALDTVSNCRNYYQNWITVTKPDTVLCNVFFNSYIQGGTLFLTNLSTNCAGYYLDCDGAGGMNYCSGFWLSGAPPSLFLARMQAYTSDSIYSTRLWKEYYRTIPYNFSSNNNYENCSRNFEVLIDYQTNGALVTMTAMNKSGIDTFWISGFGNGIPLAGYTATYFYPYVTYERNFPWIIDHTKTDTVNGCTIWGTQEILIRNPYYTFPPNCAISLQPQPETVIVGSTVQFIISAPSNITKQWQEDTGLGYLNLVNGGQYSGVNSDTLTISNVQLTMNNYYYRCVLADSSGFGCQNTSSAAVLNVSLTMIEESELQNFKIFPNPINNYLTFLLPENLSTAEIKIFNFLGELKAHSILSKQESKINTSNLSAGAYILQVSDGVNIGRQKLIKQ